MKKLLGSVILLWLMLGATAFGEPEWSLALKLEDSIRLGPQTVGRGAPVELSLPPLPAKPGQAILLRFRAVIVATGEGGCREL